MAVVDAIEPSEFRIFSVAQKAKEVLVEPVLLLMAKVKAFVTVVPVQVSHLVYGNVAATRLKSFEVHELADGKVCANAFDEIKNNNVKNRVFTGRSK